MNTKTIANAEIPTPQSPNDTSSKPQVREGPPKYIKVTITEEDRQTADDFCNCGECLIATAFHRAGYGKCRVSPITIEIPELGIYRLDNDCGFAEYLEVLTDPTLKPSYGPEVVGKIISATRRD